MNTRKTKKTKGGDKMLGALKEIRKIEGKIKLVTGLHIGSGNMEMKIGGTDNPVIKHPYSDEPYIPGSSLKGKVRSLIELKSGLMSWTEGNVLSIGHLKDIPEDKKSIAEAILKVFGTGGDVRSEERLTLGPTRVSFSDCFLDEDWKKKAEENRWLLTEVKVENAVNRIKGGAETPRHTERVPEGAIFKFEITFRFFEEDDEELFNLLLKGLKLLEYDTLGGNGSRGYGRIKFENMKINGKPYDEEFAKINPFE